MKTKTNEVSEPLVDGEVTKVIGYDCSKSNTGVAKVSFGMVISTESRSWAKRKDNGNVIYEFRTSVSIDLHNFKPDLVAVEEPHLRGRGSYVLVAMYMAVIEACELNKVPYVSVHTGTLKKFATGSGAADKKLMLKMARKKFTGAANDDEADAIHLALYGYNIGG